MQKLIFLIWILFSTSLFSQEVNVGIYQNPPKVFTDNLGVPSGFFVDLLDSIAMEENWKINYQNCTWNNCLKKLDRGELDLFLDVAFSKEREKRFSFNKEVVLSTWSNVYKRKKSIILNSILDLTDKSVGLLKNSIQEKKVKALAEEFNLAPRFISFSKFEDLFAAMKEQKVDVIIVNKFIGNANESKYNLSKTNIVLTPSVLHFVTKKGLNLQLLNAIDKNLLKFKSQRSSPYYEAIQKWVSPNRPKKRLPSWVIPTVVGLSLLALVIYLINLRLKKIIDIRSEQLAKSKNLSFIGMHTAEIIHNLNNPLQILSFKIEVLTSKYPEDKIVSDLAESSKRLKEIVKSILKKVKGEGTNKNENVNLDDVINDEIEIIKIRPIYKNLDEVEIDLNSSALLSINILDIQQIVENLINNALDAMVNSKEKILSIKTYTLNDKTFFEVTDSGMGIQKENLDKIFRPFYSTKSNNDELEVVGGTGLGLYSVKRLVESNGGEISVESIINKKTTFKVQLPNSLTTKGL